MVVVEERQVGDITAIHVVKQSLKNVRLPLVVFEHGFKSFKEKNLHYGFLLAKKGFRVVLPCAVYHGERQQGLTDMEMDFHFWDIVLRSIDELAKIKESFEKQGLIDNGRIGVAGTSMGGLVTLGALTKYPWIKVAVSLMGMPAFTKFFHRQLAGLKQQGIELPMSEKELEFISGNIAAVDLSMQPEKLDGRPLLFWHGKLDQTVPFDLAYDFYEQTKPLYVDHPEKLAFIVDEEAGHAVSREAVYKLVEWFEKYL